jgi:hypothetical protein
MSATARRLLSASIDRIDQINDQRRSNDLALKKVFSTAEGLQPLFPVPGETDRTVFLAFARAEITTLHITLDASTRNLINTKRMALMRSDAILINTARGGIVDETALKARLRAGQLAGAAFDVFATEPPQDLELLSLPNFLATPHIGGSAAEAILAMGRAAIDGLTQNAVPDPAGLPAG